jgi:hypothetical protein
MTVNQNYYDWQHHLPAPDPLYAKCSPNIVIVTAYMSKRWSMTSIGCYGWRPIRGGTLPSSHGFGAAQDHSYATVGRVVAVQEILPWLIDNSKELGISAIHDYFGCRIWHAGRGWKDQTPASQGGSQGMGTTWATYFHLETTPDQWHNGNPLEDRFGPVIPEPVPPTPMPGGFVHATVKLGDVNADVYTLQLVLRKVAGNTNIIVDGNFGTVTDTGLKGFQAWFSLTADGVAGPKTWAKIDEIVNAG